MARLVLVAFYGSPRSESAEKAHESPSVMTGPLWILLIPSIISGWFGIEHFVNSGIGLEHAGGHAEAPLAMAFSVLALFIGGSVAWTLYGTQRESDPIADNLHGLSTALKNRLWFDEIFRYGH